MYFGGENNYGFIILVLVRIYVHFTLNETMVYPVPKIVSYLFDFKEVNFVLRSFGVCA